MRGCFMRSPWTHEELAALRRRLTKRLEDAEAENPDLRPLPPMTEEECRETLLAFGDQLPPDADSMLFGQLLAQYRQAIEARMLGRRGRYFVISEADLERLKGGG